MAGASRHRVKMRRRISAGKLNPGDAGKLNHGDTAKLSPDAAAEVEGAVDVVKRPIRRRGLRINVHGELYVPDSEEEEESGMHMEPDSHPCKIRRAESRPCKIRCAEGGGGDQNGGHSAADDINLAAQCSLGDVQVATKKASEIAATMKLTPEVQARLEAVLANMDPLFHDEFVNMYKIMPHFHG